MPLVSALLDQSTALAKGALDTPDAARFKMLLERALQQPALEGSRCNLMHCGDTVDMSLKSVPEQSIFSLDYQIYARESNLMQKMSFEVAPWNPSFFEYNCHQCQSAKMLCIKKESSPLQK